MAYKERERDREEIEREEIRFPANHLMVPGSSPPLPGAMPTSSPKCWEDRQKTDLPCTSPGTQGIVMSVPGCGLGP